jgi:hypothetical protein
MLHRMNQDQARARLNELASRHIALAAEIKRVRADLLPAVRDAAAHDIPQVEIAKTTDWTREHIRNIVSGKVKA